MTSGTQSAGHASNAPRPKRTPNRNIIWGDVNPHHVELFVPRDKLEGQEVGGDHSGLLNLERIMTFLPNEGNPPCEWLVAFDRMILYPGENLGYRSSVIFISVKIAAPTPICANPLATDASPRFRPHLMFQVAIKKVPLSPDRGDAAGADIVVVSCN
jgi:hypothetical protein